MLWRYVTPHNRQTYIEEKKNVYRHFKAPKIYNSSANKNGVRLKLSSDSIFRPVWHGVAQNVCPTQNAQKGVTINFEISILGCDWNVCAWFWVRRDEDATGGKPSPVEKQYFLLSRWDPFQRWQR